MAHVQFILGRSGTGKTQRCIDAVCEALTADGAEPLILLVPEQATYQAERAILSHPDIAGFSRLHILSFNRLEFRLLSDRQTAAAISRTGKQMVLHKLLLELADELTLYQGQVGALGLAGRLSDLLDELQHAGCDAKQVRLLAGTLAGKQGQELAAAKWADIATVFEAYEAFFRTDDPDRFDNPDSGLTLAKDRVASAPFLAGARVWVDGFSGFSVQERDLLAEMLKVCKDASVALCLDPATVDLANDDEAALDPYSLFASAEQTYCQLLRTVRGCKLQLAEPIVLDQPRRFPDVPALAALEANLASDTAPAPTPADGAVQIAACGHVRAETLWVAGQIRTLVKDNNYRYRDIAVVVPDMDGYQHYIESAFNEYGLPYFLDRPRRMKTHPLTELIGAALQAVDSGFRSSDVLSVFNSPLMGVSYEQVDALGNYCRAFDIQDVEWLQKPAWDFASNTEKEQYDEGGMDALRREMIRPLQELRQALTADEQISAAALSRAVWNLLGSLKVQDTLAAWAAEDATDQQFGHRQVFAQMVELMDEMCVVLEGVELSAQAQAAIFIDALSAMTVKLIPPTLDQVLIGSIERSRHPDIKAIFLIGATQKQFPVPVAGEMLLTEQDYQLAGRSALELTNPYEQNLTHRPYLTYIALTRASKRMTLSYPLTDEKGSGVVPWSGLEQLTAMFTDVEVQYPEGTIEEPDEIQNPHQLAQWLCQRLGKDRATGIRQQALGNSELTASGILDRMARSDDETLKQTAADVRKSLDYDNAARLDAGQAAEIFTFPMTTSVSRMGTFARCPYQYFAKYTLGLEPRQVLSFEPMDVGTFYHDVLEAIFKTLKQQGKDWADLTADELIALSDAESEKVISTHTLLINFMRKRSHHRYIIQDAREVLRMFVPMLAQLAAAGHFKQTDAELKFGPSDGTKIVIPLDDERAVQLAGRIDRLDTAEVAGKKAAVVFDYKTGGKSVSFAGMLYGLDLQLPVYLLAAGRAGGGTVPAGAFFLPIVSGTSAQAAADMDAIEAVFNKAKGLFDGSFFEALDTQAAASGGWSGYFNFYVNKDGEPYGNYKNSGALTPEDFTALLEHTERCIKKLMTDLTAGTIAIAPYRIGTDSPCTWCDYRPLCRFDWQINDYNLLDNISKEEALERMKKSIG
ncbi:MAG: PD-(D/E)XK nuclease family protein [Planctomycetota bacterium]